MSGRFARPVPFQGADQGGGDAEDADSQVRGDLPQAVRPGMIRRPIEGGDRGAVGERGDDHPRPHDPADVGSPHHDILAVDVELERPFGGDLGGETGMDVYRALWAARWCPRCRR